MIEGEPLSRHTSWRIGGPARYYIAVFNPDDLRAALQWARTRDVPCFLLGGGTNLLVRDCGFPGLVVRYAARSWSITEEPDGQARLLVDAGMAMAGLARRVSSQGWRGLEWAEGLPGSVGGSVYGNAGCYGGDIASVLQQAQVLVGDEVQEWPVARFAYGYRTSLLKAARPQVDLAALLGGPPAPAPAQAPAPQAPPLAPVILTATLRLAQADRAELAVRMAHTAAQRKASTPWGSSCGSVFKNPPAGSGVVGPGGGAASAGYLIDQAGLKGQRVGAAEISPIHANYMINRGGASSDDVLRLIELAQRTVLRQFGVELELEVQVL